MKRLALCVAVLAASPCVAGSGKNQDRKIDVAGTERTYRLHLPPGFEEGKKPVPLVIVLHGAGGDGKITEALTGMDEVADKNGFAVAYPDGLHRLWTFTPRSHDVSFVGSLAETLVREKVADERRTYATGISNGGFFSNRLAIDLPHRFAAIAPVAGTIPKAFAEHATEGGPVPVLYFHGTDDKIVGYDGTDFLTKQAASLSAEALVEWWAKRNGSKDPKKETLTKQGADLKAERWTYAPKKGDAEVVFVRIEGGGHTWPGGNFQPERLLGKTCRDVSASETIWEFFSRHVLPEKKFR